MKRFASIIAALSALLSGALSVCAQTPDGVPRTIKEFLEMAPGDTTLCSVTGVVTLIRSSSGGNFYISDGTGTLFIYGIKDPAHPGWGFRQMDIRQSDTLTLSGRRQVYRTTIEMTSARLVRKADGPDHNAPLVYDKEASFKGKTGNEARTAFTQWVESHVKLPAMEEDTHGSVELTFVVGRNGGVQEVQIVKGVNSAVNEAVMKAVGSAPKWKPAELGGSTVRTRWNIVVRF